ncbi:AAA family ATPase [Methyloceanibacter sp.]|uniref:AAA family ATPase n=1 Tax=Methyloceanibacter sp. TaxID=1965321 RepID=UPI003C783909
MRALALEHLHSNPVGVYGDVLLDRGIEVHRVRLDLGEALPDWREYDLLVVMGGGMSVYEEDAYPWLVAEKRAIREAVTTGCPYFGVCLGSQLLASALGSRVFRGPEPELGVNPVFLCEAARRDPVFRAFPRDIEVMEFHSDTFDLPEGAVRLARSSRYENQAFNVGRTAYAIQCHLEPSLDDARDWFDGSLGETFEARYGRGSVAGFLDEYAHSMPLLQQTARQLFRRWLENALAHGRLASAASSAGTATVPDQGLLGRTRELERIGRLLDEARGGRSGAIVICGETGVGKTALLDAALERADGMRVLRISGVEDVGERPYAGFEELCRPLLSGIGALPDTLRQALSATLGLGTAERGDRFAAYAGAMWLLAAAAEEDPLLVCVDDAHLLDDASLEALAFIAGRIGAEGIALLIATGGDPGTFGAAEIVELQPLDRAASLTILERRFGDELSPTMVAEVVDVARGNPLALREIPLSLTPGQRVGIAPLGDALLNCRSAERAILARISALGEDARRALLVVALSYGGNDAAVARALQSAHLSREELRPAEEAALVAISGGRFSFPHPLVRSTVVYGALRSERRAAHAALAGASNSNSSIWHAALAASGPDERIAALLEDAAGRALSRHAHSAAARALELAARLSPARAKRARRLVGAAEAAALAGHIYAAIDHVEAALPELDDGGTRAAAELLLGSLLARSGSASRARDLLLDGAARCKASYKPAAARLLAAAVIPALRAGSPARACEIGRRAFEVAEGGPIEAAAALMLGTALTFNGAPRDGRALLLRAIELREHLHAEPQLRAYLGAGLRLAGEHDRARDVLAELIANARSHGTFGLLPYALVRLADVELDTGHWPLAHAALAEAASLARETGQGADQGLASGALAWLDAAQGRAVDCRRHAGEAIALAMRLGVGSRLDRAVPALGLLALGCGEFDAAIEHLVEVRKTQLQQGWCDAAVPPHRTRDLIEALVRAGRVADAEREVSIFEQESHQTERPSALAALACCRGLLASADAVDGLFRESLAHGSDVVGPFEHARTLLEYGRRLREVGRAAEAVEHLEGAFTDFAQLGAKPWIAQARNELEACGVTPPDLPADPLSGLGERELQVALALTRGETPEEAAEHLLLTVPTVKHLWGQISRSSKDFTKQKSDPVIRSL